jgi:hypothetical protein
MRLVLPNPQELDQSEISESRITRQLQKPTRADGLIQPLALLLAPLVAPDNGWPQKLPVTIEDYRPVHLARQADAGDLAGLHVALRQHRPHGFSASLPPIRRMLLRPSCAL